jgi:hypothetical protein
LCRRGEQFLQKLLQGEPDQVRGAEDQAEGAQEDRNAEHGPGQDVVDAVRQDDLAHAEPGDRRPGDLLDPVVAAPHDGMEGVLVLNQERLDPATDVSGDLRFHQFCDLGVSLHQLDGHHGIVAARVGGERFGKVLAHQVAISR